jgi:hypothetical protein
MRAVLLPRQNKMERMVTPALRLLLTIGLQAGYRGT